MNKVVLAYSGGLDTSVAVAWLKEQYGVEVVTLTVDLGGGSLREGSSAGRCRPARPSAYVVDARERFVTDYVWPHLQANALYQGAYPLATALARPLIAQLLVEVAAARGRRRRRARLHRQGQRPGPLRRRDPRPRPGPRGHRADARGHGPVARPGDRLRRTSAASRSRSRRPRPYSIDVNLWGRSCETGVLEDPWVTPPPDAYEWTVAPGDAPAPVEIVHRLRGRHPGRHRRRAAGLGRARRASARPGRGARRRPDRPRRGPPRRHQEPRDLRDAGGDHPARGPPRARGPDAVAATRSGSTGSWPTSWPRSSTTACGSAPCRATCAPMRLSSQRVVSGDVRVRLDHGQAVVVGPAVAAVACTTRASPRTTRATRSTMRPRSGSSRSSGCRCGSRRRATAPSARTMAPPGRGPSRCSRTCRRPSRRAGAAPLTAAAVRGLSGDRERRVNAVRQSRQVLAARRSPPDAGCRR